MNFRVYMPVMKAFNWILHAHGVSGQLRAGILQIDIAWEWRTSANTGGVTSRLAKSLGNPYCMHLLYTLPYVMLSCISHYTTLYYVLGGYE